MIEGASSADAPVSASVTTGKPPRGVAGAIAVVAALWAMGICLRETPTAVYSTCGTCRGAARSSLYGEGVWAVATALAAAVVARFSARGKSRVARSAAIVAIAVWIIAVGFVQCWW
jgi:hypothetical protein